MKHLQKLFRKQSSQILKNRQYLKHRQYQQYRKISQLLSTNNNDTHYDQILSKSIRQLSELAKNQSLQIFKPFVTRSVCPHVRQLNGLADINVEHALKKNANGVPFTVKDHIKVAGMIQTCGYSDNISISNDSAEVVQLLEREGCVAFAHTNVPQGLLGIESSNNLYGVTRNPFNKRFVSGGSSGGEAVMVATKASAFGIGTDTGGSVRIPAAFCGVYGFKPTGSKRLSSKGRIGVTGKQGPPVPGLDASLGFITRKVDDIAWLCQKTIGKSSSYNPYLTVNSEWKSEQYTKSQNTKKTFGILKAQGAQMQLAPAVKNVIYQTAQLLQKDGHKIVQLEFGSELDQFKNLFFKILNNSGFCRAMRNRMLGQNPIKQKQFEMNHFYSTCIGNLFKQLASSSQQQKNRYQIHSSNNSTSEMLQILNKREYLRQKYLKLWQQAGINLLISPTMPFTAPLVGHTQHLVHQLSYCSFQNILELPAGHVPIRTVRHNETFYNSRSFYESEVYRSIEASIGLPVGVQITGEYMKDQQCLGGMRQLEALVHGEKEIQLPKV